MLEFVKDLGTKKEGKTARRWCLAKCPYCGKIVERRTQQIKKLKSCGCATFLKANIKHNMSKTRQYQIWADIKERCNNPKNSHYYLYGGRGITYDPKWETFKGFWEDMKDGYKENLTIDRIDPDGNYRKENCRWVSRGDNTKNARKTGTFKKRDINTYWRKITLKDLEPYIKRYKNTKHGEKKKIVKECSEKLNISLNTAEIYLRKGQKNESYKAL